VWAAAPVTKHDLGTLLLHSLRYSVGRRSTAPSTTADLIRRHWGDCEPQARVLILRDLREEFDQAWRCGDPRLLGDECDRRTWAELLIWMHAQQAGT
jgi:hypothetical protein